MMMMKMMILGRKDLVSKVVSLYLGGSSFQPWSEHRTFL
jgi:hypothetical protein